MWCIWVIALLCAALLVDRHFREKRRVREIVEIMKQQDARNDGWDKE